MVISAYGPESGARISWETLSSLTPKVVLMPDYAISSYEGISSIHRRNWFYYNRMKTNYAIFTV